MAAWIVALLAVAAFAVALWHARLSTLLSELTSDTYTGVSAMLDNDLDDLEKERLVRRAGFQLFRHAWSVIWRFGAALLCMVFPVYAAQWLGLSTSDAVFSILMRIDFIVVVSIVAIGVVWLISKRSGKPAQSEVDPSQGDIGNKFVHTMAFASPSILRLANRLDNLAYANDLKNVNAGQPIFITSLARGGTTALLNAMHELPEVATHTYRDMPFVTAPLLWSKLGSKGRNVSARERAHSDGLFIDLDSPEAFDEVFWMLEWPEKYTKQGIDLWHSADIRAESTEQLRRQFNKIALLRRPAQTGQTGGTVRYVSKNNANISRLEILPQMFPGCDIVVPLRHPAAHAASLLRQHTNFTQQHAEDSFVKRYMKDIGHFEFGELHRPLLFKEALAGNYTTDDPDYWLSYWIAAFTEVLGRSDNLHLVVQDQLRDNPDRVMKSLLGKLELKSESDFSTFFHTAADARPNHLFSATLMQQAVELYNELASRSSVV